MSDLRGAHVEIVDPKSFGDDGAIVPTKMLINGVDVGLVSSDGVKISPLKGDDVVQVAFTLMPSRVTILGADANVDAEKPDAGLVRHHVEYRTNADGEQRFNRQWHEVAVDDEWIDVRDLIEAWRSR